MKVKTKIKVYLTLLLSLVFSHSIAQYQLKKYSINNGGGKMTGGTYALSASIGQVDAGSTLSNGAYSLNGGYWHENADLIFKNEFE